MKPSPLADSDKEAYKNMDYNTLPDSTPRREGGEDAVGELMVNNRKDLRNEEGDLSGKGKNSVGNNQDIAPI